MSTARELVLDAEAAFERAGLVYGHGTTSAREDAVFLVFHPLGLAFDCAEEALDAPLAEADEARVRALIEQRLTTRKPAAYLTGVMWFAGHEFEVTEHVLVPRSPIAELIADGYAPWLEPSRIATALEIGTGSGCIACATALALPDAEVHATDVSPDALALAKRNIAKHGLAQRVHLHEADCYPLKGDGPGRYDLIVTNPPYVPDTVVDGLPAEYHHEPALGLRGGADGMDIVDRILKGAAKRLTDQGVLVLEVGEQAPEFESRYPALEVTWVELVNGGEGVMVIERAALRAGLEG